jgi:hypothetical protein
MVLGSTQPLTEMSTRCISWGKGGRCLRLTTLPPSCAIFMKSGNLNFLEPSGPLQACMGTALPICCSVHGLYLMSLWVDSEIFRSGGGEEYGLAYVTGPDTGSGKHSTLLAEKPTTSRSKWHTRSSLMQAVRFVSIRLSECLKASHSFTLFCSGHLLT